MKFLQNFNEASKRFRLDSETSKKVKEMSQDLFFKLKRLPKDRAKSYTYPSLHLKTIDGVEFDLPIYISFNKTENTGIGYLDTDVENKHFVGNLCLVINGFLIKSEKELYNTIYHEVLHAVDPTMSSKYSKKYLDRYSQEADKYYSHGIELRGICGEFLEALVNEFKERLTHCVDEEDTNLLEEALQSIINFFNILEMPNVLAYDIIDNMGAVLDLDKVKLNSIRDIFKEYPKTSTLVDHIPGEEPYYLIVIDKIRCYSPKGWKVFLKMLYTTSIEIKEMIWSRKNELIKSL